MILEKKISYFNKTSDIGVAGEVTVNSVLKSIQQGKYKTQINRLRNGEESIKTSLPTFAMHGVFEGMRKKKSFSEASGIIVLDIDDIEEDLSEVKDDIMSSFDSVISAMVSPSGNGVKVLYYVTPDIIDADNYRQIGKQIVSDFEIYGHVDYLSVTDCLIATYDPDILINEEAIPAFLFVEQTEKKVVELEPIDQTKELWEDPHDFFDTVLSEDIAAKTNNNYHFIQVSMLDLAKFGFLHPEHDLSFVIDYSERFFKNSSLNRQRFLEVAELARSYPQIKHPYRYTNPEDDFEEEYNDYSEWLPDDGNVKDSKEEGKIDDLSDENDNGLIDYSKLKDNVVKVMKEGDRVGREISYKDFSDAFRFKGTGIFTITGIPGHGKTEAVDVCTIDLARLYGESTFIVGFEQTPEEHLIKLMRKMVNTNITCESWMASDKNQKVFDENFAFVTRFFKHIDIKRIGGDINTLLKVLAKAIKEARDRGENPKYVVFDPFNMLSIKGRYSGHEKVDEILRRLTHFSHQMGVMVILVAHPFKMKKDEKTGEYEVPDFYSVKGSSSFFEMSYHGMTVYRRADGIVMLKILKVKQNNLGTRDAEVFFLYDKPSGRYIPVDEEGIEQSGDHMEDNWLNKVKKEIYTV